MGKYYYNCEDGKNNEIACFETFEEAVAFAEKCERAKEIWAYEIVEDGRKVVGFWSSAWFR